MASSVVGFSQKILCKINFSELPTAQAKRGEAEHSLQKYLSWVESMSSQLVSVNNQNYPVDPGKGFSWPKCSFSAGHFPIILSFIVNFQSHLLLTKKVVLNPRFDSDPKNYIADFVGFKAVYFGKKSAM